MHRLRPVLSPVATNKLFAEEKAPPILEESLLFLGTTVARAQAKSLLSWLSTAGVDNGGIMESIGMQG